MNFLIANKLWLIVIGGLAGVMLGLGAEIYRLKGDIADAKNALKEAQNELALKEANLQISTANLFECNAKIALQNAKLEQIKAQVPDAVEVKERVITKFEKIKIPVKDAECEKKLKFYEELINEAAK